MGVGIGPLSTPMSRQGAVGPPMREGEGGRWARAGRTLRRDSHSRTKDASRARSTVLQNPAKGVKRKNRHKCEESHILEGPRDDTGTGTPPVHAGGRSERRWADASTGVPAANRGPVEGERNEEGNFWPYPRTCDPRVCGPYRHRDHHDPGVRGHRTAMERRRRRRGLHRRSGRQGALRGPVWQQQGAGPDQRQRLQGAGHPWHGRARARQDQPERGHRHDRGLDRHGNRR